MNNVDRRVRFLCCKYWVITGNICPFYFVYKSAFPVSIFFPLPGAAGDVSAHLVQVRSCRDAAGETGIDRGQPGRRVGSARLVTRSGQRGSREATSAGPRLQ